MCYHIVKPIFLKGCYFNVENLLFSFTVAICSLLAGRPIVCNGSMLMQVVASQDWPEVTKYAGLVSAQAHRQELIQDLFKVWQDPQRGTVTGGMIKYDLY